MKEEATYMASTPERNEPGPFSLLVEREWRDLCEKDDRTSPDEYPEMCLITHNELSGSMAEAWLLGREGKDDLLEALKAISAGYERTDINHVDFRVRAKQIADAVLFKATGGDRP